MLQQPTDAPAMRANPCSVVAAAAPSAAGLLRSSLLPAAAGRRSLSAMAVAAPAAAAPAKDFAKEAHGFELVQQQFVREYDSHVLMYKHKKTGMWAQQQLACAPERAKQLGTNAWCFECCWVALLRTANGHGSHNQQQS